MNWLVLSTEHFRVVAGIKKDFKTAESVSMRGKYMTSSYNVSASSFILSAGGTIIVHVEVTCCSFILPADKAHDESAGAKLGALVCPFSHPTEHFLTNLRLRQNGSV